MKCNPLGFLSLLSLLGVLGLAIGDKSMLSAFGFLVYIRYFFVTPDEMFMHTVRRSASIGFFSGVAATGVALALRALAPELVTGRMVLSACFVVSVLSFTGALVVLELREQRGE